MQDMTKGSITRHLIRYAIPMILGNFLQLTYNAVDSVIIGKFLGEEALAAVSSSNPIITILVLGASGISLGTSVMISKLQGAGEEEQVKTEFSTTLIFGLAFSLAVFLAGFLLAGSILQWINTPASALLLGKRYLQIYLVGFLFSFQYDAMTAAARGIGDSKTPVYFLALSCGLNVVLDYLLVAIIPMGVAGAAIATVISQAVAAGSCMLYIFRAIPQLHIARNQWAVDRSLLSETLKIGSLSALQQAAQPIGKVFIQSVINAQGIIAIDAFNAGSKIEDYGRIPTQSFGNGIMTCTAQNRGAKQEERMYESFRKGLMIALVYFPIIFLIVQALKVPAIRLLSPDGSTAIIEAGVDYLRVKAWFFLLLCLTNTLQGFFRGMGMMKIVLMGTVIQISVRTLFVYLWVPVMGITGEAYACAMGWTCQSIVQYSIYFYLRKRQRKKTA